MTQFIRSQFFNPFWFAILVFLAAVLFISPVKAETGDDDGLGEMTPISADMVCGDKGGAIHINNLEEKVWQAELNDTEGILLTVTKFQRLRCPRCFNIDAELEIMGDVIYYSFETRTKSVSKGGVKNTMKVTLARDPARKKVVETWSWQCQ